MYGSNDSSSDSDSDNMAANEKEAGASLSDSNDSVEDYLNQSLNKAKSKPETQAVSWVGSASAAVKGQPPIHKVPTGKPSPSQAAFLQSIELEHSFEV